MRIAVCDDERFFAESLVNCISEYMDSKDFAYQVDSFYSINDLRYAIDPTKIHNELGWLPETKFEDGIKKTIQWYLDNREWWEVIISGEYQNYYEKMYANR